MEPVIYKDLYEVLTSLKKQIDLEPSKWEYRKRAINPYESIFSTFKASQDSISTTPSESNWRVAGKKKHSKSFPSIPIKYSIAGIRPISRAFFKMTELGHHIRHSEDPATLKVFSKPIHALHLAEAPGGFVQSWRWHRTKDGFIDKATCFSVIKKEGKSPWSNLLDVSKKWKCPPGLYTSDLLNETDRHSILTHPDLEDGVSLVTGDGGFDFSSDYSTQEEQATPLILAEVIVGLRLLKKDGAFILKIFDCVTLPMLQILWIFWKSFRSFKIIKPNTSRTCNSEKYIVARGFKGMNINLNTFLNRCENILCTSPLPISTLFYAGPNMSWETMDPKFKVGANSLLKLMKRQIESIQLALTIDPLETNKIRKDREFTSQSISRKWCSYYNIPIHQSMLMVYPES